MSAGRSTRSACPGNNIPRPLEIHDAGVVVGGASSDGFVTGPGFINSNGVFTAVNVPGATETYIYAINNLDQIAGGYFVGANFYPFVGTPVLEPATWTMMVIGFAGLQFAGYQRRKAVMRAA